MCTSKCFVTSGSLRIEQFIILSFSPKKVKSWLQFLYIEKHGIILVVSNYVSKNLFLLNERGIRHCFFFCCWLSLCGNSSIEKYQFVWSYSHIRTASVETGLKATVFPVLHFYRFNWPHFGPVNKITCKNSMLFWDLEQLPFMVSTFSHWKISLTFPVFSFHFAVFSQCFI